MQLTANLNKQTKSNFSKFYKGNKVKMKSVSSPSSAAADCGAEIKRDFTEQRILVIFSVTRKLSMLEIDHKIVAFIATLAMSAANHSYAHTSW